VLVPSTYLWRRTIQDQRVNALWQRLRRSLLLLLQLLAVLAAAVALCGRRGPAPFCAAGGMCF
jgi:lipopolysaccharide/colanic/teichoic acid biosynthesis glycosyltransferase